MKEYTGQMTTERMREVVLDDHRQSRGAFVEALPTELEAAIAALSQSYAEFQDLQSRLPDGDRSAVVFGFLHVANNSLISARHHLASGFLTSAGNLMRQFAEATAMSIMCSEKTNQTFESYSKLGLRYPVHNAIDRLGAYKMQRAVRMTPEVWRTFKENSSFYNSYSHASDMAVAANIIFDRPGTVVLAGQFDPGKVDHYRAELAGITSGAEALYSLLPLIEENMARSARAS